MVGDLRNFYSNLTCLPKAMKEAEEFPHTVTGKLDRRIAEDVAEAFAEKFHSTLDYPSDYDLVIWEYLETAEGTPIQPTQVFRVQIQVQYTAEFYDSHGSELPVPAPAQAQAQL